MAFYFYSGDNTPKDAPISHNNKSTIDAPMIYPPTYLFFEEKEPILDISLGPDYLFVLYESQKLFGYGNIKSLLENVLDQLSINENCQINYNFNNKSNFTSILTGENFLALLTNDGCVAYAIKNQKIGLFQNKKYVISAIRGHSVLLFIDTHKNLLIYDQKTQKFFNVSIPNIIDAASYRLNGKIVITVIDSAGAAYEYINDNEDDVLNDIEFTQIQFPQNFNVHFVERVFAKNESVFYVVDGQEKGNNNSSEYYVFAKGCNKSGMLGVDSKNNFVSNLKQAYNYINKRSFKKIEIGENHTIFVTTKNYFFAVGSNEYGQLLIENADNPKYKVKLDNIWCGGNRTIFKVDAASPYLHFFNKDELVFHFPLDTDSAIKQKDDYIHELESKLTNSNQMIEVMEKKLDKITKLFESNGGNIINDNDDSDDDDTNSNNNNENDNDNEYTFDINKEHKNADPLEDELVNKFLNKMNDTKIDIVSRLITRTHLVDYFSEINQDPSKNEELQKLISKTNVISSLNS